MRTSGRESLPASTQSRAVGKPPERVGPLCWSRSRCLHGPAWMLPGQQSPGLGKPGSRMLGLRNCPRPGPASPRILTRGSRPGRVPSHCQSVPAAWHLPAGRGHGGERAPDPPGLGVWVQVTASRPAWIHCAGPQHPPCSPSSLLPAAPGSPLSVSTASPVLAFSHCPAGSPLPWSSPCLESSLCPRGPACLSVRAALLAPSWPPPSPVGVVSHLLTDTRTCSPSWPHLWVPIPLCLLPGP